MKVAKTLPHKITNHSRIFDATLDIYNDALAFIIEVIDTEFDNLDEMTTKSIVRNLGPELKNASSSQVW